MRIIKKTALFALVMTGIGIASSIHQITSSYADTPTYQIVSSSKNNSSIPITNNPNASAIEITSKTNNNWDTTTSTIDLATNTVDSTITVYNANKSGYLSETIITIKMYANFTQLATFTFTLNKSISSSIYTDYYEPYLDAINSAIMNDLNEFLDNNTITNQSFRITSLSLDFSNAVYESGGSSSNNVVLTNSTVTVTNGFLTDYNNTNDKLNQSNQANENLANQKAESEANLNAQLNESNIIKIAMVIAFVITLIVVIVLVVLMIRKRKRLRD